MRHLNKGRKLNRNSSHRKAMFRNMCVSLFEHEQIRTTLTKAKELRIHAEPLITLAKNDSVAKRRQAFSALRSKAIVAKLFSELGPKFQDRPGGYIRILKCGYRAGDKAPMAIVELIQEAYKPKKAKKKPAKKAPVETKSEEKAESVSPVAEENIAESKNDDINVEELKNKDVSHPDEQNVSEMKEVASGEAVEESDPNQG